MKKFLLGSVVVTTLLIAAQANAGFLVEPYLGYRAGTLDIVVKNSGASNGEYEYTINGSGYGLRAGYGALGFMAGIDYGLGSITEKFSSGPSITLGDDEYDTTQIGAFLGYNLPIMFRVWASYYFTAELEIPKNNSVTGSDKGDLLAGSGLGIGVGFTGLPIISINLEYKSFTYDEFTDGITGVVTTYPSNTIDEITSSEILLSISAPFDF
ncbi:MAG: outer membrane beta-barrel protein [Bdellovibrionales bacterium]|jgi:hypothetical protein|nr:outer membrane beta-barrel protein [Bdellovibrionales bacterium]MBT3526701.1 outer membrane beta-barrel protein [Bdellovibrionales bacterium]MBT7767093.1 outer membrane beta-barrel protein [Bdellovibrionales bacterium]